MSVARNAVAIELERRGADFYYHSNKHECDFIIRKGYSVKQALQVTAAMDDPKTRKRELNGILDAMDAYNLQQGLIVTIDSRETIKLEDGRTVEVVPCWQWMLNHNMP